MRVASCSVFDQSTIPQGQNVVSHRRFEDTPNPQYRNAQDSSADFDAARERIRTLDQERSQRLCFENIIQASQDYIERTVGQLTTTQHCHAGNLERMIDELQAQVSLASLGPDTNHECEHCDPHGSDTNYTSQHSNSHEKAKDTVLMFPTAPV